MGKLRAISMLVLVGVLALAFAVGIGLSYKLDVPKEWMLPGCIGFALVLVTLQYLVGPWLLDWILQVRWTTAQELGPEFAAWNGATCRQFKITEPRIGIIDDGMPNAFTYGHGPWNGRVIVSRGLIDVLDPQELKAVYAHELGHIKNKDFIVMTLVQALVLVLYCFARVSRGGSRDRLAMTLAAYAAYWISYYISLMFSRIREYMADYASAQILQDPNALSRALVKISYGLAQTQLPASKRQGQRVPVPGSPMPTPAGVPSMYSVAGAKDQAEVLMAQMKLQEANAPEKIKEKEQQEEHRRKVMQSLGAFGISNAASMRSAVAWFSPAGGDLPTNFAQAARWELFNPWAKIAEFVSTHPLTANRIQALQKLNRMWGKADEFDFSKIQPGKYRGFLRDLLVLFGPTLGAAGAAYASFTLMAGSSMGVRIGMPLAVFFGLGLMATLVRYRTEAASRHRVLTLLSSIEVSHVAPKYVVLEGEFTGLLGAGFIWANDYILQDETGYVSCLYQQPFALFEWIHGYLHAQRHLGRPVRVYGWYRRFTAPYLEIDRIEFLDDRSSTKCWFLVWSIFWQIVGLGIAGALMAALQ